MPKTNKKTKQTKVIEETKKSKLADTIAIINKKFPTNKIGTLSEKMDEFKIEKIPTRSVAFNKMLYGGLVKGKISELYGDCDSGKTSMALDTIGYNMSKDKEFTAAWFETEGILDSDYAINTFGIDPDRLTVWSMEDNGAEKGLDILEVLLRSGEYNIVVINTVAGLTPSAELAGGMEDATVAVQARMMSKLMRKIVAIASKNKTHVMFINQVRANVGTFKSGNVPTGGKALSFWATQRIIMKSGFIDGDMKKKGYDPEKFKLINCSVKKNRCSDCKNPYTKSSYFVEYGVGIDMVGELPELAKQSGVIDVRGAWHYDMDDDGKTPKTLKDGTTARWGSAGDFRTFIRNTPWYADELRTRIMNSQTYAPESMSEEDINQAKTEEAELTKQFTD